MPDEKKKVVYLLGAGATQADINIVNDSIRLTTKDIVDGIRIKIDETDLSQEVKDELKSELGEEDEYIDIEQLITLYESTGVSRHHKIATNLKSLFRQEVLQRLPKGHVPKLITALIDMHEIEDAEEKIVAILTLNYDSLAEYAVQQIRDGIDYVINFERCDDPGLSLKTLTIPILKLHGSFNWKNDVPLSIVEPDRIDDVEDVMWIPPGVIKRREQYPYSLLWAKARELLNCDILRIIGCSLNRNDWELISLLYTTKKFNSHKQHYTIQLIDYEDVGKTKQDDYPYLSIERITELKEVREYIRESFRVKSIGSAVEEMLKNRTINIFEYWLRSKGEKIKRNKSIKTNKDYFSDFMNEKWDENSKT